MKQRRIVISGVSRGLGRALALELVRRGHVVFGCGRDVAALTSLRGEVSGALEVDRVDVAAEGEVRAWAARVLGAGATPDLLVNNAALINRNALLWELPAAEFDPVVDVNIKGVANMLRHFLPSMVALQRGVVVNFSSGWGRSAAAEVAPYCATKWAIEGLTQALAQELPAGMAAVPLNPGVINTEMLQSCFGSAAEAYPLATEWAERAVPFLLGLSARDNGQSLSVP